MPYANLPQIMALSKTESDAGLEIEPFPKLKSQSNTHIAEFNAETVQWSERLVVKVKKAISEAVKEP